MADRGSPSPSARARLYATPVRSISIATHTSTHWSSSRWSIQSLSSSPVSTANSSAFWRTPPRRQRWSPSFGGLWQLSSNAWTLFRRGFPRKRSIRWVLCTALAAFVLASIYCLRGADAAVNTTDSFKAIRATLPLSTKQRPDPIRWLKENSDNRHAVTNLPLLQLPTFGLGGRPRAAIISLVRNSELEAMMHSMRQLEFRWNSKYKYPWVFFNDEPFSEKFKAATRNLTTADCHYEVVPKEHWSLPDWIDEDRFMNGLEYLGTIGVGKGWMVSYHHMCRWNSGFFYKHPFLQNFNWYWRVEPNVHYFCDIEYDVFRFMRDNGMKYGFNMNILDDARSFPSLWPRTRDFVSANAHLIHPEADLTWLLDPHNNDEYNNCQFFSNFEIGSLDFWRSKENEAYFNWLDTAGGFYYERFGDAPVHTLSVGMFVPKSEVWFFRDIGYQHDINHQCPVDRTTKCACEPTRLDENFYKLVPLKSPQRKPVDTCIRQFLGGEWLRKKEGWSMSGEKAFGGDGYHGYVLEG